MKRVSPSVALVIGETIALIQMAMHARSGAVNRHAQSELAGPAGGADFTKPFTFTSRDEALAD